MILCELKAADFPLPRHLCLIHSLLQTNASGNRKWRIFRSFALNASKSAMSTLRFVQKYISEFTAVYLKHDEEKKIFGRWRRPEWCWLQLLQEKQNNPQFPALAPPKKKHRNKSFNVILPHYSVQFC